MKKNISSKLVIILCLLTLFSCKVKKQLTVARKADTSSVKAPLNPPVNADSIRLAKLNAIKAKQTDFNTFSGKASAKLTIGGKEQGVTMNIRIKKDQEIWVSITAVLGLEVGRAVITPDSIKMLNRLESTYLKKPFSYVYQYTSSQVNYKMIESILIGNAINELLNTNADMKPDNGDIVVNSTIKDLVCSLIVGPDLRVSKTTMTNPLAGQAIDVANAQFIQTGNQVIPSQITINSTEKEKSIKIDMRYTKTEFDQAVEFPFTIPSRFSAVN